MVLVPLFLGCDKGEEPELYGQIREIAWNYLDDREKSTVITEWSGALVGEGTFQGKVSYAVYFNTTDDALLGPIVVYVDKSSLTVIGQGLRL